MPVVSEVAGRVQKTVIGSADPLFRLAKSYVHDKLPPNPRSRYLEVTADHLTTPEVARDQVVQGHRPAQQVTLQFVAAHLHKQIDIAGLPFSFGNVLQKVQHLFGSESAQGTLSARFFIKEIEVIMKNIIH